MRFDWACCCNDVIETCETAWGDCDVPVLVSLTVLNGERLGSACDSGALLCDWEGSTIVESFNSSLNLLEFEYVAASMGVPEFFQLKAPASNTGSIVCSVAATGTGLDYPPETSGDCTDTFSPAASGEFDITVNDPPGDFTFDEWAGTIKVELWFNGSRYECRFVLRLSVAVTFVERFDYSVLRLGVGAEPFTVVETFSADLTYAVELVATAPYSPTLCPHQVDWTIATVEATATIPSSVLLGKCQVPEPAYVSDCPVGFSTDCGSAGSGDPCFYSLGWDGAMAPYLAGDLDASGYVLYSMDTPSLAVTVPP